MAESQYTRTFHYSITSRAAPIESTQNEGTVEAPDIKSALYRVVRAHKAKPQGVYSAIVSDKVDQYAVWLSSRAATIEEHGRDAQLREENGKLFIDGKPVPDGKPLIKVFRGGELVFRNR